MREHLQFWFLLAFAGLLFLYGKRVEQLGPHRVNYYVAGQLRGSMMVTNSAYVHYVGDEQGRAVLVTNYYWRVWSIFK